MIRKFIEAAITVALACVSAHLHASLVTHHFSGMITKVQFWGENSLDGQIQIGLPFTGYYQFDGKQKPLEGSACQSQRTSCYREFPIPPFALHFTIGTLEFDAKSEFEIYVTNDALPSGVDFYNVYSNVDFGSWLGVAMTIGLSDPTGTAIHDPRGRFLNPPKLKDFAEHVFVISGRRDQGYVVGELETLERTVPEPSALYLLGLGFVSLWASYRLRSSSADGKQSRIGKHLSP